MKKGDIVLITYSKDITKVATFVGNENGINEFFDKSGYFLLSDKFINEKGIKIELIEE